MTLRAGSVARLGLLRMPEPGQCVHYACAIAGRLNPRVTVCRDADVIAVGAWMPDDQVAADTPGFAPTGTRALPQTWQPDACALTVHQHDGDSVDGRRIGPLHVGVLAHIDAPRPGHRPAAGTWHWPGPGCDQPDEPEVAHNRPPAAVAAELRDRLTDRMVKLVDLQAPSRPDPRRAPQTAGSPDRAADNTIDEWRGTGVSLDCGNYVVTADQLADYAERVRELLGGNAAIRIEDEGGAMRAYRVAGGSNPPRPIWEH